MEQVTLSFPDSVLVLLNKTGQEIVTDMQREYAARMFQAGNMSIAQGAEFCGIDWYDFLEVLGSKKIPVIDYSVEELDKELKSLGLL